MSGVLQGGNNVAQPGFSGMWAVTLSKHSFSTIKNGKGYNR